MRAIIDRSLSNGGGWLEADDAASLFDAARLPIAATRAAASIDEAVATSEEIGYPVVLKASGKEILHKSDVGGVKLSLGDADAVRDAYTDFQTRLGDSMTEVIVQKMIGEAPEVMIGVVRDPTFGHLVVYGAGGVLVELLADVAFRILPITEVDAEDMMEEVKTTQLLRGYRGAPPADEASVRQLLLRLSALVEECPEIEELDVNPLKVLPDGAIAVDMRVRVTPLEAQTASRRITY